MALSQLQEAWVGAYGNFPHVVNRFFTRRIKRGKIPFMTNMTTINYEFVEKFAKKAKILQRGASFPVVKMGGSAIKSVTPEVIRDAVPFAVYDSLNRKEGQPIYINGTKVDNATYERDRRISTLKQSIETVTEEISAGVFLQGKYVSPDTNNEVAYTFPKAVKVNKSDITNWAIWLTEQVNSFSKDRKVSVTEILVGKDIFNAIYEDYNKLSNNIVPAQMKRTQTEDGDFEMHLEVFGFDLVMIPDVAGTDGKTIDTSKRVQFYNDLTFLPAYAGVVNVDKGVSTMEAIDTLIRETSADEETGEAKTLGESAYCPIVVNPTLTKIIEIDLSK